MIIRNLYIKVIKLNGVLYCKKCLNEFECRPDLHLTRHIGCPICNFKHNNIYTKSIKNKQSYLETNCSLYLVMLSNQDEKFIKIGVTTSNLHLRFKNTPLKVSCIKLVELNLQECLEIEKQLISTFKQYKYLPKTKFNGYTECLDLNCLDQVVLLLTNVLLARNGQTDSSLIAERP